MAREAASPGCGCRSSPENKHLGIIAGQGHLPFICASAARQKGYQVDVVAVTADASPKLESVADTWLFLPPGQWGQLIRWFHRCQVDEVILVGKVPKKLLYAGDTEIDERLRRVLAGQTDSRDASLLAALIADLESEGFRVLPQTDFAGELLADVGNMTFRRPSPGELRDMKLGLKAAAAVADLDIGQTVVVKGGSVVAVEALEGTDATIRRAGQLAGPGAVVVKVARTRQDERFDLPAVGMDTLEVMADCGASVLAVEAGKTLLVYKDEMVRRAEEWGITLLGVKVSRPPTGLGCNCREKDS